MGFPVELVKEMLELDEEVVGAIYPKREIDLRVLHSLNQLPYEQAYARALRFLGKPGAPHPRYPGFREVESIGAGILLISRRCIDRLIATDPSLCLPSSQNPFGYAELGGYLTVFDCLTENNQRFSEDLSFCYRWRRLCNGKIYAATHHNSIHVGQFHYESKWADVEGNKNG